MLICNNKHWNASILNKFFPSYLVIFNLFAILICIFSSSQLFHVSQEVILPLSTGEATSGVLCPVPSSPVQDKHGLTGVSPVKGQQDD